MLIEIIKDKFLINRGMVVGTVHHRTISFSSLSPIFVTEHRFKGQYKTLEYLLTASGRGTVSCNIKDVKSNVNLLQKLYILR